jgi:hypothetical protein
LPGDAVPITRAPARSASRTSSVPTPPAAPCTSTVWPAVTFAVRWIIWYAVTPLVISATTSPASRSSGTGTRCAAGTTTRSDQAPVRVIVATRPLTDTPGPAASTCPTRS